FFGLALATRNPWIAVPALCLALFVKDFAMPVTWSTCLDIGHRYSGTVSGFMNMIGNLGNVWATPFVAALAVSETGQTRWEVALLFSLCMFALASLAWVFINPG